MRVKIRLIRRSVTSHCRTIAIVAIVLARAPLPVAQDVRVGDVAFPNSGSPAAQGSFLHGLAQLHNFEYDDAARAFRSAQQIDPDFAMAYWGEAMTKNHPVWMEQDLGAARRVLDRLGGSREARIAKGRTERERAYLAAVEALYGAGDKNARDIAYLDVMASTGTLSPEPLTKP